MIVKGPNVAAGSVFSGNVVNYDLLPTFVDWAGGDPSSLHEIDGVSLASYLAGTQPSESFLNRNLYFHYPHYRSGMPHSAMVSRNFKVMHFYDQPEVPMLFDLAKDRGEVHNIAPQNPEKHAHLFAQMMGYLKKVDARIPKPNPAYDPEVYQRDKEYEKRMAWGAFEGSRPLADDEK